MRVNVQVQRRTFQLTLTEEEAMILHSMVNFSDAGLAGKMDADDDMWKNDLTRDEAMAIAKLLRDELMHMYSEKVP